MTIVRIPAIHDGAGRTIAATATIILERAPKTPRETWCPTIAIRDGVEPHLLSEYSVWEIPPGGLLIDLAPQSSIRLADGTDSTGYRVEISSQHRTERFRVQAPDSADVLELADLALAPAG